MKNEFKEIQEKTKKLITEENYSLALEMLMEEVTNPLFNLDEQNIINRQITSLTSFINQLNQYKIIENASKSDLIKLFLSSNYELTILNQLLEKYAAELNQNDLLRLNNIFLDENLSNEIKVNFLNIFKDFNIVYNFKFFNFNINQTFNINSKDDFEVENYETLKYIIDYVESLYFKETNKENIGIQLIHAIYYYYFNRYESISYQPSDLANNLIDLIEHTFNSQYEVDKEFLNWITKIIN